MSVGLTYFEACFEDTWLNVQAVLKNVILDDGDSARPRQRRKVNRVTILGCEMSGRRRNGHLKSLNRGNENKWV